MCGVADGCCCCCCCWRMLVRRCRTTLSSTACSACTGNDDKWLQLQVWVTVSVSSHLSLMHVIKLEQDAIGDSRLHLRCRQVPISTKQRCLTSDWFRHLANWTKICVTFVPSLPIRSIMRKHDVIHKTGSTYPIAVSSEKDQATATSNMCRKFDERWTRGFCDMRADRHTDKQTDRRTDTIIAILCTPTMAK